MSACGQDQRSRGFLGELNEVIYNKADVEDIIARLEKYENDELTSYQYDKQTREFEGKRKI
jgi:hypothetical protein